MSLIPEVISNITETPAKASSAAVNAIIAIGLKFLEWSEESRQGKNLID